MTSSLMENSVMMRGKRPNKESAWLSTTNGATGSRPQTTCAPSDNHRRVLEADHALSHSVNGIFLSNKAPWLALQHAPSSVDPLFPE